MIKLLFKKYFTSGLQIIPEHYVEEYYFLAYGTVKSNLDVWDLSEILSSSMHSEVRESSHFEGGYYVSVRDCKALITAEKIEDSEFLLRGEGTDSKELWVFCKTVSVILEAAHIEHRIELYDEADKILYEYIYSPVA